MSRSRNSPPPSATPARRGRVLAALAALLLAPPATAAGLPAFKILVEEPGPYRVSFEDLSAAGLESPGVASAGVGLFHHGHPVPVWVEDGGDGVFGPGDSLELIGELPHGWVSHVAEYTRYNVYFLRLDAEEALQMTAYRPEPVDSTAGRRPLRRDRHYEQDLKRQSLAPPLSGRPDERWYWAKLSHLDGEPFAYNLDIADLELEDDGTVDLAVELRGWSQPRHKPAGMADHRLEVLLNGYLIGEAEWDGTEPYLLELDGIAANWFKASDNNLVLKIPKRAAGEDGEWLIDVVMLNWIEIAYPRLLLVGGPPADFRLADPTASVPLELLTEPKTEFMLYGRNGSRMTSDAVKPRAQDDYFARTFHPATGESSFVTVSPDRLLTPEAIVRDRPSRLSDAANHADYIMIAHRRLLEAIRPLASFHRSRGLAVEVVDVQDVYDEFSGGQAQPWALRAFLEHAYHRWRRPAPRFVLLVGDASANAKDVQIGDGSFPDRVAGDHLEGEVAPVPAPKPPRLDGDELKYIPYGEETDLVNRHLIPTWNHATLLGHAASDNHFASVADGDDLPDLAIGRLPVVEPADVRHIVDKTISYMSSPEVGPWRRNIVFLTNTLNKFHRQSRWVAGYSTAAGYSTREIYPLLEEPDNEQYTRQMLEALNQGQAFVHYLGHGGRYIWETGQRDLKQNRDLFTLEHLDTLVPNRRLPVVLSLTCFTAPFDHPHADSIGEKLLRIEDRGAIAVIAASQTNGPSGSWGLLLLDELTTPGNTIGEAVMNVKRALKNPDFVKTYNLLGDPAVLVAKPAAAIDLSVSNGDGGPLAVRGTLALSAFSGELMVDLVDADRRPVRSVAAPLDGIDFDLAIELAAEEHATVRAVRAYAWDVSRGIDAAGAIELDGEPRTRPDPPVFLPVRPTYGETDDAPAAAAGELRSDLVAWWSLDTDGRLRDRLDNHHGTLVDHAGRASGPHGALAFHGRGFVDLGSDPRLDLGAGDFTLQAWIRTRQARRRVWVILDKRADAGYHLYNYWGHLGLQLADGEGTNYEGPFIADGHWHHVAVTVDRDRSDGVRWFVDGREAAPRQDPTARQGSLDNPSPLTVGGRHVGGGHFVGDLGEIAVFRRALAAADVERLYRGGWEWLGTD